MMCWLRTVRNLFMWLAVFLESLLMRFAIA